MYWTGKVWHYDDSGEIKKLADVIIDDLKREAFMEEEDEAREKRLKFAHRTANSNAKIAMIKETEHLEGIPLLIDELDCYTDFLNVQNGVVNLRNGELIPHDASFMMSKICNCDYDPTGEKQPERWLKFLFEVCDSDLELMEYLQKCVGYSLTGSVREQCAFFLYGLGNNGKSTFLETISDILGDYASNAQPDTIMMRKFGDNGAGSDIARLRSARMVTTEEPTEGVRLNEGLLKQLTGGGKVTCRFLYGDEFEYSPEFKIWIATNHKPIIQGTDVGIWRRIRLIPFEVNIPPEKVDKQLKYKFREEMPQILRWAVEGCMLYHKEGLEPPKRVQDSTAEYKAEMDLIATFMEACVVIDYTAPETIPANELYSIYTEWAKANNEYVMTSRKFFGEFGKRVPEKRRISSGVVYQKLRLTEFAKKFEKKNYTKGLFYYND
jgi:putative DNA primase/helicase